VGVAKEIYTGGFFKRIEELTCYGTEFLVSIYHSKVENGIR
jgi:hypothetical protein